MRSAAIAMSLSLAVLAGGCGNTNEPSPIEARALQEARAMYDARCAVCHNGNGDGNGPSADAFNPRPHDYTSAAWQASITDDQIKEIILRGGRKLGKSPAMPSNSRLRDRPEVLDGLVKIIRGFGKHP